MVCDFFLVFFCFDETARVWENDIPSFSFSGKTIFSVFSLVQVSVFPQAPFNFVARPTGRNEEKFQVWKVFLLSPRMSPTIPFPFGATITRERKMPTWKKIEQISQKKKPTTKKEKQKRKDYIFYIFSSLSYPEGNFGGNQQLDGSMGLSPLYPSCTNDLHVSIETSFHQSFLWLHSTQA